MSAPNGTLGLPELSSTPSVPAPGTLLFFTKTDGNAYLLNSSGVLSAIGSTEAITSLTGDVSATGPGSAAATVNFVGGQSAANIAAAVVLVDSATNTSSPNTLVKRDGSGNFSANIITATLNGNAATSTSSTTAINFTGSLYGDVTGTQSATVVSLVGGETASNVALSVMATQAATPANTASTIVERDASGNFSANTITANLTGNASGSASSFTGSLSGDVTGTQSATSIASSVVTSKLLTGLAPGTSTPILATNSILTAFENLQAQISGTSGTAITALTGDVSATGPGSAVATVNSVGGYSASAIAASVALTQAATAGDTASTLALRDSSGNIAFSTATLSKLNVVGSANVVQATIQAWSTQTVDVLDVLNFSGSKLFSLDNSGDASFAGTLAASNFSGSSSGTNTGNVTVTNTNSIDLAFTSGQTGLNATLNLSADAADAGYMLANTSIHSGANPGLLVEVAYGTPVNVGTSNYSGSAASFSLSDHVHAITSPIVLALLLTGYTTGSNTPITASNTFLQAFENLQAQISSSVGSAITSLTGDVTATGPGAAAATVTALQGHFVSTTAPTDAQMLLWVSGTSKWTPESMSGDATISDSGVLTLDTVNSNTGTFGSSTAIPSFTVNGKGLITAVTTDAVVAPAGTLSGTTLNSTVVNSSLTSVGTITSGVWNGTALTAPYMLPLATNEIYVGNGSNQPAAVAMSGDATIVSSGAITLSTTAVTGKLLTGYTTGTNTPITATNSILTAFENLQAQISATVGSAITSLTGDVTATGPGSAAATIASNAVTYAKFQQVAASSLVGNPTGSLANAQGITLGSTLTFSGSALQTDALTGDVTSSANSFATTVAKIQGTTVSGTTGTGNVAFSASPTFTGTVTTAAISGTAITGTSFTDSSLTPGSIPFIGAAGLITQDNANFFWNDSTIALGIGTNVPADVLNIVVSTASASRHVLLDGYGANAVGFRTRFAAGTVGSPSAVPSGTEMASFGAVGYGTSQFASVNTGAIHIVAGETFTNASNATYMTFLTTATGSVAGVERMRLNTNGNLLLGTTTDAGQLLQVNGTASISSTLSSGAITAPTLSLTSSSTTALTVNSTSFVVDSVNNAIGVGIAPQTTSTITTINSSGTAKPIWSFGYGIGSSTGLRGDFARGTMGSPAAAQSGDVLNFFSGRGYGTSQFAASSTGAISIYAGETFTNASNATYISFKTTPTGSVANAERLRINSTGNILIGTTTDNGTDELQVQGSETIVGNSKIAYATTSSATIGAPSSTSIHQINGGLYRTNKTITSSYTVDTTTTDDIIYCNQSAAITITLPVPTSGRTIVIKDTTGVAQTNSITIAPHASEKIEGLSASKPLYTNFGSWTFSSDGTNWWMI